MRKDVLLAGQVSGGQSNVELSPPAKLVSWAVDLMTERRAAATSGLNWFHHFSLLKNKQGQRLSVFFMLTSLFLK